MIFCIDFDGTCVTHEYPAVGKDIGAIPVLKELAAMGHQLILWTMRSGEQLEDAVKWFATNDIPLFGVNQNPTQASWTSSPKAYAQLYIDDAALGCPLYYPKGTDRPFVDWEEVRNILLDKGLVNKTGY